MPACAFLNVVDSQMIRLIVDGKVLAALSVAFPKKNKAQQYLTKYVENLEQELNRQVFRTRPVLMLLNEHFHASLTKIQEKGGQIWSLGNVRVHKWLADNNLALVEQVNTGQANNITGEIAIIKLTKLVQAQDDDDLKNLQSFDNFQLEQHLQSVPAGEKEAYQPLLDSFNQLNSVDISDFDLLSVDIEATICYIKSIVSSHSPRVKEQTECRKALRILRVAQLNNGVFPQRKRRSPFGRTYYEGVSIQSVHKDLRKAVLYRCYEYDVKSSVICWKYAFAEELLKVTGISVDPDDEFWAIYYYLIFKPEYFHDLQLKVFDSVCDWTDQKQKEKIKEAITALSFGAKLADVTWKNEHGKFERSSLASIFPNEYIDERKKFIIAPEVVAFKKQQSKLDIFIVNKFLTQYPYLKNTSELKTKTGRLSNSKVLAWLYQHAETQVMNIVREELAQLDISIRANIHDAIVIDRQLSPLEKSRIETIVREKTGLMLFSLGETRY
jgi:hypothetical protein